MTDPASNPRPAQGEQAKPPAAPPQTLLDWLAAKYPGAKRTTLRRMVQDRRVRLNGRPVTSAKAPVGPEDQLTVDERPPRSRHALRQGGALPGIPILFEDADVLVINKPAGLLTSTVPREKRPTALAKVREYVGDREPKARVMLIHRLDRDAAGVLIFAKTPEAFRSLKKQFAEHTVQRIYHAVVQGVPTPRAGRIGSRLVELPDGKVRSSRHPTRGELAITHYETLRSDRKRSLLRVRLETGRKHQIRVHLSERGVPIVNDSVYGRSGREKPRGPLMLVATELTIDHPRTGKRQTFRIEPGEGSDDWVIDSSSH